MERRNIDKIAQSPEDRLLLAKVWDKIHAGMSRNIIAHSPFLSLREQELVRYLFGNQEELVFFGGHADAERKMLVYLPAYLSEEDLYEENSPLACLRADFYAGDDLSHRDFLGALMGVGISRETVGDIYTASGSCDFLVSREIAPYVLQNLQSAARTKLTLTEVPLRDIRIPRPELLQIRDTLSSLRLDSIISSGFRIPRSSAAQSILAGKTAVNGLPCEKPDKLIEEGATVSVRGLGRIKLSTVNGLTKKGRISVVIDRYV